MKITIKRSKCSDMLNAAFVSPGLRKVVQSLLFYAVLAVIIAGCQGGTSYKIAGNITGADSLQVFLIKIEDNKPVAIDTADVLAGRFVFTGNVEGIPELYYLRLGERNYFAPHFLEKGLIKVEAQSDSLQKARVTGTPQNDVYTIYKDEVEVLMKSMNQYRQQYSQAVASGNEQEVDRAKIDFEASQDNMMVFAKNFIKEHNTSVVAPHILISQLAYQLEYDDLKALVDAISPDLSEAQSVKDLNSMVESMAKTKIGAKAPDFTMNDVDGNPLTMSSLTGKNYLLLDFWAAWCGPCRHENPNIVAAYKKFKDKGFDILGISLDRDKNDWLKAIKDDNLTWHQVSDLQYWQNEAARLYGVRSIPHSLLLDKDGIIVAKNLRGEALEQKLSELMP